MTQEQIQKKAMISTLKKFPFYKPFNITEMGIDTNFEVYICSTGDLQMLDNTKLEEAFKNEIRKIVKHNSNDPLTFSEYPKL